LVANSCLLEVREMKHTGDLREQTCWAKCVKLFFSGLNQTSQPAASPLKLLFTKPAEQCFSLTTNQLEQCFSAKFQTSERGRSELPGHDTLRW